MPQCSVCRDDKASGNEVRIYTARVISQPPDTERGDSDFQEGRQDTEYGDFQEHRYFVCSRCHRRWDWRIVPLGAGVSIIATLFLASTALRRDADWLFAVAIVVLIGGLIGASTLTTGERLKRTARRARGRRASAKAFNEQEYRAMMHMG